MQSAKPTHWLRSIATIPSTRSLATTFWLLCTLDTLCWILFAKQTSSYVTLPFLGKLENRVEVSNYPFLIHTVPQSLKIQRPKNLTKTHSQIRYIEKIMIPITLSIFMNTTSCILPFLTFLTCYNNCTSYCCCALCTTTIHTQYLSLFPVVFLNTHL